MKIVLGSIKIEDRTTLYSRLPLTTTQFEIFFHDHDKKRGFFVMYLATTKLLGYSQVSTLPVNG